VERALDVRGNGVNEIGYADLLDMVATEGGVLEIPMSTVEVATERRWRFPYSGYGYAWAARMISSGPGPAADLTVTDVGRNSRSRFPYRGYGFAWEREVEGTIAGNPVHLEARDVESERRSSFMWIARGYAWTKVWEGTCGPSLAAMLSTTTVGRRRASSFMYRGYGYAWVREANLRLESAS
jgi:hypothetical protein